MASLLIIGGSGFFGKSILDGYLRGLLKPWDIDSIIVLSRHASQLRLTAPELMHRSISLVDADISTCTTLPFADYVIHAAASTDINNYLERPAQERENIQRGTYNYCELAKKFHQKSKILYVSSGAVYGKQPAELVAIPEDFDPGPIELMDEGKRHYAAAKRDAEQAIMKLGEQGLNVCIARCFAFIGKYLPRDQHFAIGNFIKNIINREPIEVKATKVVSRTYMDADDLVSWLLAITFSANFRCLIYNVGSDEVVDLSKLAIKLGKKFELKTDIGTINQKSEDRYVPSIELARNNLGLKVRIKVIDAISAIVDSKQLEGYSNG